ncbi:hypothetical protein BpHYR1_004038 [Brachionus plicatilis]|uniref:C-type lectin domain-containing protein n=1 Tax=Brachionus plicatilis TaxID=10195 RepID=A0A3M7RS10_BRAPC|nr:hypothetical protein BpHYR1_004038 [Brachionus plicatilis]
MIKLLAILNLIHVILCQNQQKPLPSPSFGRIFNNTIKTRNFGNGLSACTNPGSYGFIQRAGTTKYYLIADIQMNWIDGENYCQSFGAHLPVAASARFVGGKFMIPSYNIGASNGGYHQYTFSGYWLGFYKSLETNSWRLIDDSPLIYFDWASGQPDEGFMRFGMDWYSITVHSRYNDSLYYEYRVTANDV